MKFWPDPYNNVFHEHSTIVSRPAIRWPGGKRAAFCLLVSVEYYEMQPPFGSFLPPNVPGGFGRAPYPDMRAFTQREYGNRVGVFRVIEAVDKLGIPAAAAIDANVSRRYPYILDQIRRRDWEILGHGISVTQVISNQMSESDERDYVRASLQAVADAAGTRPLGWHGPEYGESERTPTILAENGIMYLLDWPNDEQPYRMNTPAGTLISIPPALELDDVITHFHRRISMTRWAEAVGEAMDELLVDSRTGRHLVLNVHPWLIGHPHRIGILESVLEQIRAREDVWITTPGRIAAHAADQI